MKKTYARLPLLLQNIGFSMVADLFSRLGNSLVLIMVSRLLGKAAGGALSLGLTYFYFGSFFAYWGFGNLLIRDVAQDHGKFAKYFSNFLRVRIFFGFLFAALTYLASLTVPTYSEETRKVILIILATLPLQSVSTLFQFSFVVFEKIKFISIASVMSTVLELSVTAALLLSSNKSLLGAVWIQFGIAVFNLVLYWYLVNRFLPEKKAQTNWHFIREQIAAAFPFFLLAIFLAVDSRIDVLILSYYRPTTEVGAYSAMTTLLGIAYIIPEGMRNAIFPAMSRYKKRGREELINSVSLFVRYTVSLLAPFTVVFFFYVDHIVKLVFGSGYTDTAALLQISIWSLVSYALTIIFSRLLIIEKHEKILVWISIGSSILTLVLNVVLVKRIGLMAVSIVKLVTSLVLMIALLVVMWKKGFPLRNWKEALIALALSGITFIVILYIPGSLILRSFLGISFYLLTSVLLGVVNHDEIVRWKNLFF